jgi:predicted acyltransferase
VVKKIWTSSFVLVAGGWSLLLLAAFYGLVDVLQWRRWCQPLVWIGMNPIMLYVLASIVTYTAVAERIVGGSFALFLDRFVAQGCGNLVVTLIALVLIFLLAQFFHRRGIFLRV